MHDFGTPPDPGFDHKTSHLRQSFDENSASRRSLFLHGPITKAHNNKNGAIYKTDAAIFGIMVRAPATSGRHFAGFQHG